MKIPHQKTGAECEHCCRLAEQNVCLELPVVAAVGPRRPLSKAEQAKRHKHRAKNFGEAYAAYAARFDRPCKPMSPDGVGDPNLESLVRYAKKFGTECVFETGEHVLPDEDLHVLDRELSAINRRRPRVFQDAAREEERQRIVELAETMPVREVALEVRRSESYVRKALREAFQTS